MVVKASSRDKLGGVFSRKENLQNIYRGYWVISTSRYHSQGSIVIIVIIQNVPKDDISLRAIFKYPSPKQQIRLPRELAELWPCRWPTFGLH